MRWEEMPKGHTAVVELVRQFETHCRLEGKPETTCSWYRGILDKFLQWAGEVRLDEFTLEKVRGYLGFLKNRPRFAGHPTTPSNGATVSAQTFSHHAVVLRVFARWLRDEGYTAEHRLERLKTPQVPETLVEVLTPEEYLADYTKRLETAGSPLRVVQRIGPVIDILYLCPILCLFGQTHVGSKHPLKRERGIAEWWNQQGLAFMPWA